MIERSSESVRVAPPAKGAQIAQCRPFFQKLGHRPQSSFLIWLLAGFLVILLVSYVVFMCYCACHVEELST